MKKIFLAIVTLALVACGSDKLSQAEITVSGNCEMCKETIEGSIKVEGVKQADWNVDSKKLTVKYDSLKVTLDQIQQLVATAGYDNEKYKADSSAYSNLPDCCQYER